SDLEFPNGMATRQGPEGEPSVLVVAESGAGRITEFDIGPGGELTDRRMLVDVPVAPGAASANPDGICLDPSGDVWVPDTVGHRVVCLGGHGIVHDLRLGGRVPLACEIVSDSAATHLAIASVDGWTSAEAAVAQPTGRIDLVPLSSLEA
ncbi:MAG: SMP-30/gluconolactonase/LRE family protein, partial [Acidimicrobiales bacterium]|nr:SMP-30/gluconolactonase/LRE family protein [Acidimicrobiales bacterium]